MKRLKIKDIFRNGSIVYTGGIIHYLYLYDKALNTPILSDFINANTFALIDEDYLYSESAEKYVSPVVDRHIHEICDLYGWDYYDLLDGNFPNTQLIALAKGLFDYINGSTQLTPIIHNRFAVKWKKIWDALNTAYNPLENYSMLEERTPDLTKTRTLDTTDERTPDLTKTTNGTGTTSTDSQTGIFGFNSAESNPSGTIDGNQTDTITDRTETETGTDTSTQSGTITDTETGTETLERSGNIGITSSQQMLMQEFEVRKYDFYKEIYKDIDSVLCLKIY